MLTVKNCAVTIGDRFGLKDISFEAQKGAHIAVIGESGCGKTTLLKLIYGLYDLDKGVIVWDGKTVTGPKENLVPGMDFIKYLAQDFDLMPYISVEENVQKFLSRRFPEESADRTATLLEVVEMTAFKDAHVKTLSGGQKQRVALAQTLAKAPELLLLDEPFSHIDNFRKNNLRRKLFKYLKEEHITCLVATHDSTDILSYTDQTIVMRDGHIIADTPTQSLYKNPKTHYVASLFGEVNELPKQWFVPSATQDETLLVYPHQLKASDTGVEVIVNANYFKGSHFLIEAVKDHKAIFFNSYTSLKAQTRVYLAL